MSTPTTTGSPHSHHGPSKSRFNWVLIGFLAIGGFFLFTEHQAHVLGALPFLLLLACPLLHLFGHGSHGHGRHDGHGDDGDQSDSQSREDKP